MVKSIEIQVANLHAALVATMDEVSKLRSSLVQALTETGKAQARIQRIGAER